MSKSGISLSYWNLPALAIVQLINGVVDSPAYKYVNPGDGIQYLSLFGVNAYASTLFYVSTIGTYRLTFNYACSPTYSGNPLRITLNGNTITQLSYITTSWTPYTIDININEIGNHTLLFKGMKGGTQTAISNISVILLGGSSGSI